MCSDEDCVCVCAHACVCMCLFFSMQPQVMLPVIICSLFCFPGCNHPIWHFVNSHDQDALAFFVYLVGKDFRNWQAS